MEQVLIVGSGITGGVTASILRKQLLNTSRICIWDKANDIGGRMGTNAGPDECNSTVDLGAQFISATPENYQAHQSFYGEMLSSGILKPMADPPEPFGPPNKNFMTPAGMNSIVKYYLDKSGAELKCNQWVSNIDREENQWTVRTEGGESSQFDCVVITIPVPQILELSGSIRGIIDSKPDIEEKLKKVEYIPRFALGMFYKPGTEIKIPWKRQDFPDDPCLKFVSIDTRKREIESADVGPSVSVQANEEFSIQHLEEDAETVCREHVIPRVQQLVPQLPLHDSVQFVKWRYSRVTKSYEGNPGVVVLHDQPLLLLGGDAFTNSGFDMCVNSALALSKEVIKRIS